jgi:hypothetical protein
VFSLITTCLTLYFALVRQTPDAYDDMPGRREQGNTLAAFFIFSANILVVCLPLLQIVVDFEALKLRLKGLTNRLKRMDRCSTSNLITDHTPVQRQT